MASSTELKQERDGLAGCVLRLNWWLPDRGGNERVEMSKWNHLDSSMGVERKQDECNLEMRDGGAVMAHESDVATTLNVLANLHSEMQRFEETEEEYMEALEILRRLVEEILRRSSRTWR